MCVFQRVYTLDWLQLSPILTDISPTRVSVQRVYTLDDWDTVNTPTLQTFHRPRVSVQRVYTLSWSYLRYDDRCIELVQEKVERAIRQS